MPRTSLKLFYVATMSSSLSHPTMSQIPIYSLALLQQSSNLRQPTFFVLRRLVRQSLPGVICLGHVSCGSLYLLPNTNLCQSATCPQEVLQWQPVVCRKLPQQQTQFQPQNPN